MRQLLKVSDFLAGGIPLVANVAEPPLIPWVPLPSGPADGVNHRRHMRLRIIARDGAHLTATYLPKGKSWPQPGQPLGAQEAARRRRQRSA